MLAFKSIATYMPSTLGSVKIKDSRHCMVGSERGAHILIWAIQAKVILESA